MTKQRGYYARCSHCGTYPAECKNCGNRATGSTPFSDWLRSDKCPKDLNSRYVDAQNLDYIWNHYGPGWFILLEEKQRGKQQSCSQSDTHEIVAQLLEIGAAQGQFIKTMRGRRPYEFRGYYKIVFQNTTPDDSDWVQINGHQYAPTKVLELLRTGSLQHHESNVVSIHQKVNPRLHDTDKHAGQGLDGKQQQFKP